ncbi:MAG: hypothetical protein PHR62_13470 [Paludibacter sp.]|nr:hypothetical protein [Paludibacter sp.]
MKREFIYFIIISVLCFWACSQNNKPYYFISFNNPIDKVSVKGKWLGDRETEKWSIYDGHSNLLSQGNYHNGLKVGKWKHYIDKELININWSIYTTLDNSLTTNYPSDWQVVSDTTYKFRAHFGKNCSFTIELIGNDDDEISIDDFNLIIKQTISRKYKIEEESYNKMINNQNEINVNKISILKDDQRIYIYEASCLINKNMYDFFLKTTDSSSVPGLIFLNILQGCYIKNIRIINPLYPTKLFTNNVPAQNF